ncbi:thiol reductant ABC exporter subunit CydC [Streptomyces zagrosensis]|uniref:ATP-binding cassette subfamily C protein/ATP-binding cassette subfamily C protein CydC n=1 Tax=Streptomyces zagrosensis TaxID=1042984 RepID=A0A7W9QG78_9ACTN|nr:thiol reductant ABC exporter subunit CydC [Streptomyces zagrosensis]MBB5938437.1 ATP-binding cassette subfamily C protein/ATP-binding cassette subfamily C protein CydC [Streptomyces zagrosensis]
MTSHVEAAAAARTRGPRPTVRLLRHLLPYWRRLLPAALASAGSELAAAALLATAAWLITRAAEQPPLASVSVAIVAVRALALGRGALRYTDRLLGHDGALRAIAGFRTRVYEALVPLAPAGIPAFRDGDLLTRLVDDVDAAQDLLLRVLIPSAAAYAVATTTTAVAALMLPQAGLLLALLLTVAGLLLPALVLALSRRTGHAEKAARAELATYTVDLHRGAADLAAYGARGRAHERAHRVGAQIAALEHRKALTTSLASAVVLLLQSGATVGVSWLALHAHEAGALPAVHLTVLAVLALVSFEALAPLPAAARRLAEVRASARRLAELFDTPPPVADPPAPVPLPTDEPIGVDITDLRVRHRAGDPPALDGVNLRLPPGHRVVLIGASGSGKSTLIAALMRFVPYEAGSIRVGGRELRDCAAADVRRVITGVTQDAHVFHTTIRANLLLARPEATAADLREAARRARLLNWIETLPDRWDTLIGGDGATMSGGQRQRLFLTRALLADPPVLVLDEPTEGLDPDTAAAVLADILDATRGRTTLLITHDRAGLAAADEIVTLDRGRIVPVA